MFRYLTAVFENLNDQQQKHQSTRIHIVLKECFENIIAVVQNLSINFFFGKHQSHRHILPVFS